MAPARRLATTTAPGFAATGSKSRLNFLDLLRAGHTDYTINDAALDYVRELALAGTLVQRLTTHNSGNLPMSQLGRGS